MELKLALGVDHCMASVVATGVADNGIGFLSEKVNDFSFSLITPLCTYNCYNRHATSLKYLYFVLCTQPFIIR